MQISDKAINAARVAASAAYDSGKFWLAHRVAAACGVPESAARAICQRAESDRSEYRDAKAMELAFDAIVRVGDGCSSPDSPCSRIAEFLLAKRRALHG